MTAAKILAIAKAELGTTEQPANSNKVKYNDTYGKGNIAWCCVFVWWVFRQAGADKLFYGGGKTAYCPDLLKFHKGQAVTGNYRPGDIIFFNFSGGKGASHVGICESFDGTTITTIDGNTGTDNEANGGAVMRRKRNKRYVIGAYRPDYQSAYKTYPVNLPLLQKGCSGDSVTALQILLTGLGYSTGGVDGQFGTKTEKALENFQGDRGLEPDKKCGPVSWKALIGTT